MASWIEGQFGFLKAHHPAKFSFSGTPGGQTDLLAGLWVLTVYSSSVTFLKCKKNKSIIQWSCFASCYSRGITLCASLFDIQSYTTLLLSQIYSFPSEFAVKWLTCIISSITKKKNKPLMMSFLSLPSVKPLSAVYFQSIKIQRDSASFLSKTFPCLSLPQRPPLLVLVTLLVIFVHARACLFFSGYSSQEGAC